MLELLYLMTSSPKQKRRRDFQNIAILRNFVDDKKLSELEKTFLFQPKQPSPMHPYHASLTPFFFFRARKRPETASVQRPDLGTVCELEKAPHQKIGEG